jgi:hypothetical protein
VTNLIETMAKNWSALELAWTVAALIGIVLSSRALSRATTLALAARQDKMEWPTRRRLIKRIRDALGAYLRHIGFVLIGINAMAAPAPQPNPDIDVVPGLVAAAVLITVILMDIVSLRWDERDWLDIVRALREDERLWERLIADERKLTRKVEEQYLGSATTPERTIGHDDES